jgi:membrane associated rhomboid family serine protease
MANTHHELLEMILRECAAAQPHPWHPATFVQLTGAPREPVEASLDQLRINGLVCLTPWVQGQGQGYQLTPHGVEVLKQPRLLARLREGEVPQAAPQSEPEPVQYALAESRGEKVRNALLDDSRPIMTQALLVANIFWSLVGAALYTRLGGDFLDYFGAGDPRLISEVYHDIGSLGPPDLIVDHQWWRLVSYGFIHAGLIHLGVNMYALFVLGPLLERMWGRAAFLAIYFVSCVGGGAAAVVLTPDNNLVGASGAICGLLGAMFTWLLLNRAHLPPNLVAAWQRNIITNIILITIISLLPGISWAGHLGGGLTGAIVAAPLNLAHFGERGQKWLGWVVAVLLTVAGLGLLSMKLAARPNGVVQRTHNRQVMPAQDPNNLLLLQGEEAALNVLNMAEKVGNKKYILPQGEDVRKLQAVFAKDRGKLDQILTALSRAAPTIPQQAKAIKAAIPYLDAASKYGAGVENLIGAEGPWNEDQKKEIRRQRKQVEVLLPPFKEALQELVEAWPRN